MLEKGHTPLFYISPGFFFNNPDDEWFKLNIKLMTTASGKSITTIINFANYCFIDNVYIPPMLIFLMIWKLSDETIKKIREEVKKGKEKMEVAIELGINRRTVYKYTRDMPRRKKYSPEVKEKIREMVKEVGVKAIVARELDVPESAVYRVTKDINPGKWTIGIKSLQLLKEITENGCALLENSSSPNYHILKKHFPMIQKVHFKGKTIIFLPYAKDKAVRAFLENMRWKVVSYHELKRLTRLFDAELEPSEKRKFLSKNEE